LDGFVQKGLEDGVEFLDHFLIVYGREEDGEGLKGRNLDLVVGVCQSALENHFQSCGVLHEEVVVKGEFADNLNQVHEGHFHVVGVYVGEGLDEVD
jgi:hypothetical protein